MVRFRFSVPLVLVTLGLSVGIALSQRALAQTDPISEQGIKPYGAYHGGDIDVVSLVNGKLDLHAPLFSYPQRGKLHMGFTLRYQNPAMSVICIPAPPPKNCSTYRWFWGPGGVQIVPDVSMGWNATLVGAPYNYYTYSLITADGSSHELGNIGGTSFESLDATAMHFDNGTYIATDSDGVQYHLSSTGGPWLAQLPTLVEDPNGNEITATSTGWKDTLNRAIPNPPTINSLNGTITGGTVTTDYSECSGPLTTVSAALWNLPGPSSGTTSLKLCFANVSVSVGSNSGGQTAYSGTPYMLQSIVLPNDTTWTFQYDGAGNLSIITLPTGGTISYTWGIGELCGPTQYPMHYYASVGSRTVNANDGTGAHTWTYSSAGSSLSFTVTVTDPVGNNSVHTMTAQAGGTCSFYETQEQDYQGAVSQANLLKTVNTSYSSSSDPNALNGGDGAINVVPTVITTTWPNNKVAEIDKSYDTAFSITGIAGNPGQAIYGKVMTESEYGYGSGSRGSPLRTATNAYQFQSNGSYQTANLMNLPASVKTSNGSGYKCAETDYTYDTSSRLYTSGISTQHVSAPNSVRGNLSATARQISSAPCQSTTSWTSSITSYKNVYDTGEVYQSIDPLGNTTTYTYDSTFFGAYVTKTQEPDTSSPTLAHHITQDWYDPDTGLKTSHTDENSNPTTYTYEPMWRVSTITPPAPEGEVTFTYTDTPGRLSVEKQQVINGSSSTAEYDLFDGLGRPVSHVVANGQATPYDKTDTCYDVRGLKSFVSYPYQTATYNSWPACPISQPGDAYVYDGIKRTSSVTHSDSTAITSSYTGAATSVTDEGNGTRGVQKVSQVDGIGRLLSVCEVTATTLAVGTDHTPVACGQDIAATGFLTTYAYDGLSNLTSVSQGSNLNQRSFTYDSLSRLITTTNPEAGTTCFGTWSGSTCNENYDADSNVLSRTRPAPNQSSSTTYVTATYTYDPLNRLRTKTYSDGTTPSVTLDYDETSVSGNTLANTTGRLSSEYTGTSSAMSSESILSYAAPGWVATDLQCTPQNCAKSKYFTFSYGYDGVGDITGSGNGNGITYTLSYSTAPRLIQVATNWLSPTVNSGNLISTVQYNAFGEPSSASLGNGISEGWGYDTRGRLQSYAAGTAYTLRSVTYSGNSNILSATDSVNGTWSTYTYDDFNRLVKSACTAGCPGTGNQNGLAFSYVYDRYGNRWQQNLTVGSSGPQPQYAFDANNRITTSGFTYDAAGNIGNDSVHAYTYDAENRIVKVDSGSTGVYTYDAEGRRVAKTAGSSSYEYLFDLGGRAVTELIAGTATTNRTESYGGGRHLAVQNVGLASTWFIHTDWLGTERVRTSLAGGQSETCVSLAYGDSLTCTGTDVSPLHFTGKMHDGETGLDDFPARYYSSTQGRWYSPDWASAQVPVPYADLHNPQSLNLYDYVGSDPTNHADADGHAWWDRLLGFGDAKKKQKSQGQADAQTAQNKSWFQKALGYFYFKVGKGEGFGVKDVKIGPAKADIGVRWNGKDFKQTTKGMQVTTVNSEAGAKVELGPIKLGVQRTNTQEEGQPAKVEWLPGFEFGKAEGTNSEVGIGGGGCFLVCGQVEVGVQMDKVLDDVRDAVGSAVERVLTQPVSQ